MIIKIINSTVTGRNVKFHEAVETTRKASVRICRPHFFIAFFGFGDGDRAIWCQSDWL